MGPKVCGKLLTACDVAMLALGGIVILGGIALAVSRFPYKCFRGAFEKELIIRPNSSIVNEWLNPTVPVYMEFYVFNVTNADDVVAGGKPILTEHGPYTYLISAPRDDIAFYENDTVSYEGLNKLFFQWNLSNGTEEDVLFHVNIPLITVSQKMDERTSLLSGFLRGMGIPDKIMDYVGDEDLIISHTAKEIIFGYQEPMFESAGNLLAMIGKKIDPVFGPFHDFNNSGDGVYLVDTGRLNHTEVNQIQRWNGIDKLPFWSTKYANMINGTDGSFLKPRIKRNDVRYIYDSHMCRSIELRYEQDTYVDGITTYRYHYASDILANVTVQPDNAGFCVPEGNCFDSGVLNAAPCGGGGPIVLSMPHLYLAAKRYQRDIVGIKPNKSLHDSIMDVEPASGAVLRSRRCLQLNVKMVRSKQFSQMSHVRDLIFPYFWLGVKVDVGGDKVESLRIGIKLLQLSNYLGYIVIVIGCLFMTKPLCQCGKRPKHEPLVSEDN